MPKLTCYHLTLPHGLHIGRGVENLAETHAHVPSDSLFAALLDVSQTLGFRMDSFIQSDGKGAPAFRVTSAFPFAGRIRFYPMPVDLNAVFSSARIEEFGAGKNIKKIRYFSEALFEQWCGGNQLDGELEEKDGEWGCKTSLQNGAVWLTNAEKRGLPETLWAMQTLPRVTVDRINSAPTLFQSERVFFSNGCGLWFGAVGDVSNLPGILETLGEGGLGGERTSGYGSFTCAVEGEKDFLDPSSDGRTYLLSRYHPCGESEINSLKRDGSAYRLESVGGWLKTLEGAAQRRKRVWMLCEGSLIAGNPQGDAPDVRPTYSNPAGDVTHPVFRPGFAVGIQAPHFGS